MGKDTAAMFSPQSGQHKHQRALLMGVLALLTGCGTGWFLHMTPRDFDSRLKLMLGGGGNASILMHGRSEALLVDTKFGNFSMALRTEIETGLVRRVRRIVLTHAHFDHAAGLQLFPEAGAVMVHPNAKKRLEAIGVQAPFVEVEREVRLMLGGDEVRVLAMGNGHTDGDLVALLPGRKLLIVGDLMNNTFEPYCDPLYGGDILALSRTLPKIMTLDFEQVVPGHGDVMSRSEAQELTNYVTALQDEVRKARAAGLTEDQVIDQVKLPQFVLESFLGAVSTRKGNVRAMFRALEAEGKTAP